MELILLGTGNAMVTKCYNTCFAFRSGVAHYLVDAGGGNGILRQLELAEIPAESIEGMFITHGHTDHILGAVWIVRKMAEFMKKGAYTGEFVIRCHDEAAQMLNKFCEMTLAPAQLRYVGNGIRIQPVAAGEEFDALGMRIRVFDILSTKAKQFGFSALLPDGKQLTCLGDEPYNPAADARAEGSDWLLSEAFCLYVDRERFHPYEKHHSTVREACLLAEELHIPNLVLWHTEEKNLTHRKELYTAEGSAFYNGRLFVPDDRERIRLS